MLNYHPLHFWTTLTLVWGVGDPDASPSFLRVFVFSFLSVHCDGAQTIFETRNGHRDVSENPAASQDGAWCRGKSKQL